MSRSRKIKLLPTAEQRAIFRRWMGGARFVYNTCVDRLRADPRASVNELQKELTAEKRMPPEREFLREVPSCIRQGAIRDFKDARKAALANLKAGNIRHFEMRHRSRKDKSDGIEIECRPDRKAAVRIEPGWVRLFPRLRNGPGPIAFKMDGKTRLLPDPKKMCRLQRDRVGDYYLIIPTSETPAEIRGDTQAPRTAALDPGVRSFQAYYSVDGEAGDIGSGAARRLHGLHKVARALLEESRGEGAPHQRRRNLRRVVRRIYQRMDDLRKDLHYKVARFLCRRFDVIFVPPFRVSKMVIKEMRKINSLTATQMLALGHYRFGKRLKETAEKLGCRIRETSEWYTSKTCGACGHCHAGLGGNKVFRCPSCGVVMDRDLNGARNNLMRGILFH